MIRAVKDKSPEFEQRGECQTNDNISSHEVSHIENTSLIMKYIHKKFSWKSHSSYAPSEPNSLRSSVIVGSSSATLSTEFNEIFKQEESSQEMENIGSTVDFEDLKLEGHSDIQDICLTYLAEDVPYMEEKKSVFLNAWYEINIGEKLVGNWIAFARDGIALPRNFHVMTQGQLK